MTPIAEETQTEQKWSREFPIVEGGKDAYYWVRRTDSTDVVITGFSMGKMWLNGVAYERDEMSSHLFLGPITPADSLQVSALASAARAAHDYLRNTLLTSNTELVAQLETAIAIVGEEEE